jgi:hypothetical protein
MVAVARVPELAFALLTQFLHLSLSVVLFEEHASLVQIHARPERCSSSDSGP